MHVPAFHNFLTVSVLNYAIFSFFFAIYLFILTERTAATRDLIYLFLVAAIIGLAYFLAYLIPVPLLAYHRWVTVAGSLFAVSRITTFFLNFPDPARPALRRIFVIAADTTTVVFTLVFVYLSLGADKVYEFDGHFYDLDMPALSRISGLLILGYTFAFIIAGLDCARRSSHPVSVLIMLLAFSLIVLVPGIVNIFHRYDVVDRTIFQVTWNISGVGGTFILVVVYVGVMKERTTLLMKIYAILLMTVLLVLQVIDFEIVRERESNFHELMIQRARNLVREEGRRPEDLTCIAKIEKDGTALILYESPEATGSCREDRPQSTVADLAESDKIRSQSDPASLLPEHSVPGMARFRIGSNGSGQKMIAYTFAVDGAIYRVDFRYDTYRLFLDRIASKMNLMQLGIIILIAIGYPSFFLRTILRPLHSLLSGVEQVNRGDLDARVSVQSADELGFLSRSFNSMVESIRNARSELKSYAEELEFRVLDRTEELRKSFAQVQALKESQDGDYFLTARLIRPLSANTVPGDSSCHVRFALRQRKRFQFRHWTEEIGGDFCTAHQVILKDRPFIFCVNADAMGKSIQGAGGALVLGAVLQSLIERSTTSPSARDLYPEIWLKHAFVELHRVFESFNGSMLVSAVLALLDSETGFLYFINAEHPAPILYRDGSAQLFEEGGHLRKLGTTGLDGFISIRTMALRPGDTVILASDGRDDVILGQPGGERSFNEDSTLFLRFVEEGDGDPERILGLFEQRCEPIDDVSILSLTYRPRPGDSTRRYVISARWKDALSSIRRKDLEPGEAIRTLSRALQEYPENLQLHRLIAQYYVRTRQYGRAIIHMEKYIRLQPEDEYILYRLFRLLNKKGLYSRAAEYGEIYHLRHPEDAEAMTLLADIFGKMNDHVREGKLRRMLETMGGPKATPDLTVPTLTTPNPAPSNPAIPMEPEDFP